MGVACCTILCVCPLAGRPRRRPDFADTNQYRAYQGCLLQHFKQHRWIAFIDADEFLVFPQHNSSSSGTGRSSDTSQSMEGGLPETHDQAVLDPHKQPPADFGHEHHTDHVDVVNQHGSVLTQEAVSASHVVSHTSAASSTAAISNSNGGSDNLGVFLSQYEHQAAIGVNWVLFGSSGHLTRPAAGPLASFTACVPRTHWESTHVKVWGLALCSLHACMPACLFSQQSASWSLQQPACFEC